MRRPPRSALLWWTAVVLGWTAVGLFSTAQGYASAVLRGIDLELHWLLWVPMLSVWLWVLFTPAVWWLGRRFRIERRHLPRAVAVHLVASLALATVDGGVDLLVLPLLLGVELPSFWTYFASELWVNVFSYFTLVAIVHAVEYSRLYRREHETAEELSHRLAEAQLETLRAHLHPHFLFNAINGAAELVHESPEAADRMLTRLGGLLRRAFEGSRETAVPLEEELSFAEDFLDIAKLRFGDRLTYAVSATGEARRARVPGFLLQPILENAVRHGIEGSPRGGEIRVDARVEDGRLRLTVFDTGAGLPSPPEDLVEGHGLTMVRRLLAQMYGDAQELTLCPREGGGTMVVVRIPGECGLPPERTGARTETHAGGRGTVRGRVTPSGSGTRGIRVTP